MNIAIEKYHFAALRNPEKAKSHIHTNFLNTKKYAEGTFANFAHFARFHNVTRLTFLLNQNHAV
jgi:hypothetical protein